MLKLSYSLTAHLLTQPESGMGYQVVEATLTDDRIKRGVVYNAELLLFEEYPQFTSFAQLMKTARTSAGEIKSLRVVPQSPTMRLAATVRESSAVYGQGDRPAKDAPPAMTKAGEVFKRFSAYENDRRIRPDGSLLPGTYATTEEDAKNVNTGKQAVARYALPNPEPASNVFTVRPQKDTTVQVGIVQPAYDQPGGGVEVLFTEGTQPRTVTGPEKIPDE
jgi:hypothetical protein